MSKWTSEAEARNQIKDLVKDYYEAFKNRNRKKNSNRETVFPMLPEYMMKKKCAVLLMRHWISG